MYGDSAKIVPLHVDTIRSTMHGGNETSNVVRIGDGGTDENTGGGNGGGIVEDVTIFVRSDNNGQDQERVHQRDSTGGTVWGENTSGISITEVVWTCTERILLVFWEKDAEDRTARKNETGRHREVYGCNERRYRSGGSDGGKCIREDILKMESPLWRPLMREAERRTRVYYAIKSK